MEIGNLEKDFDGRLLIRGNTKHAMRLTTFGTRVAATAQLCAGQLGDLHGPRHKPKAMPR
ncbi:hypothetical protein [Streptomyces sp. NPDC058280]|uniref:hypothetical protein n=1 Tax=Streptomyces sp. NPDC058280 TaxID=3346419 RepID=UPI0036E8A0A7